MGLEIKVIPYTLQFKFNARTSRGSMREHKTWFLAVSDSENPEVVGVGECAPFEGLSIDDKPDFERKLRESVNDLKGSKVPESWNEIEDYVARIDSGLPAVKLGFETALRDLYYAGQRKVFDSPFYNEQKPIEINGLVWIGDQEEMFSRLEAKVKQGFNCIKIKIGSLSLDEDLKLLSKVRELGVRQDLVLRVDANGAFSANEVNKVLELLLPFNIHSIEQPIMPGQLNDMRKLCETSPIAIALDEELIGIHKLADKRTLLETIRPQFIVLKPTLLGGFVATNEWITLAEALGIGWWITSALESNIGLNAICQFASQFKTSLPQGLGTGGLYSNNIPCPLTISNSQVYWDPDKSWDLSRLNITS